MKHVEFLRKAALLALCLVMLTTGVSALSAETIRPGEHSERVRAMQLALSDLGFSLVPDGKFGANTMEAVRGFQRRQGLEVDGLPGSTTLAVLYRLAPSFEPGPQTVPAAQPNSEAASGQARVNTNNRGSLNLRSSASYGNNIVGSIPHGEVVEVLSRSGSWTRVTYGGTTGYVVSSFLSDGSAPGPSATVKPESTPAPAAPSTDETATVYTKNRGSLNLRQEPKSAENVIAQIPYGTKIALLDRGGAWCEVMFGTIHGYVMTSFLRFDDAPKPSPVPSATPEPAPDEPDAPDEPAAPAPEFTRTLRSGYKGKDVSALQRMLIALNYSCKETGTYDAATLAAVRQFQAKNSLKVDGLFGRQSAAVLLSGSAREADSPTLSFKTLRIDNKDGADKAVSAMQKALADLGYPLSVNGRYDIPTHQAVVSFQQRNSLPITGIANPTSQSAMFSKNAKGYSTPVSSLGAGEGKGGGPSTGSVKLLHWFDDVKKSASSGQQATVYSPSGNTSFKIRFYSMGHHADSEPLTWRDTQLMNRAFGTPSWNINIVYVKLPDGRWTMAAMHNRPHLTGALLDNGFGGHLCIHFLRDTDEVNRNDPDYGASNQRALRKAWLSLTGETIE